MYGIYMIFTTPETANYYRELVQTQRKDWFLPLLFLPADVQERVIAWYALEVELAHVHHAVKEEMLGHIRYAWWQEAVEGLAAGQVREQPVLQALHRAGVAAEQLLPLVELYQQAFPEQPQVQVVAALVQQTAQAWVAQYATQKQQRRWQKATQIIAEHRIHFARRCESWLLMKLLFVW